MASAKGKQKGKLTKRGTCDLATRSDTAGSSSPEVARGAAWLGKALRSQLSHADDPAALTEEAFALFKTEHPAANDFLRIARRATFWESEWLWEDAHKLYYLAQMGLGGTSDFHSALDWVIHESQTAKGYIQSNGVNHLGPLRVLVKVDPQGEPTRAAMKYYLDNIKRFDRSDELATAILTLNEADPTRHSREIARLAERLKGRFQRDGSLLPSYREEGQGDTKTTALGVQALSRVLPHADPVLTQAIRWIKRSQKPAGDWDGQHGTAQSILALIATGGGPMVPKEHLELSLARMQQQLERARPRLISTNPLTSDTEIRQWIRQAIYESSSRLWVCSRFVSEYWTDLANLQRDKPALDVRLITIPRREARQNYVGAGKKFVDPAIDTLQKCLKGKYRESPLLHARAIIADDAVLVSTADLTPEQLDKEFNLGIWTRDPDAVQRAVDAFLQLWDSLASEVPDTESDAATK